MTGSPPYHHDANMWMYVRQGACGKAYRTTWPQFVIVSNSFVFANASVGEVAPIDLLNIYVESRGATHVGYFQVPAEVSHG